jgi:hypothetical protein
MPDIDRDSVDTLFLLNRVERGEIERNSAFFVARRNLPDGLFPEYPLLSNFYDISIPARIANMQRSQFIRAEHQAILERHSNSFLQLSRRAQNDLDSFIHHMHYINHQLFQVEHDIDIQVFWLDYLDSDFFFTRSTFSFPESFPREDLFVTVDKIFADTVAEAYDAAILNIAVDETVVDSILDDLIVNAVDVAEGSAAVNVEAAGSAALDALVVHGSITTAALVVFAILFELLLHGKI